MRKTLAVIMVSTTVLGTSSRPQTTAAPSTSVAVVAQLYHDYAWEVVLAPSRQWRELTSEPRGVLAKYFDDRLTMLLVRDRDCTGRKGECNLDGSPIWDSNDPEAFDLTVAATRDSSRVAVSFRRRYPNPSGTAVTLSYRMLMTPRGWRVSDIVRADGSSLVIQLSRK